MWIVKNRLRAVLKIEGTAVEIPADGQVDLDGFGREAMEALLPLAVAFEEGYLENVHKDNLEPSQPAPALLAQSAPADWGAQLEDFKRSIIDEIRSNLVAQSAAPPTDAAVSALLGQQIGAVHEDLATSLKGMMSGLEEVQKRLSEERAKIVNNPRLSQAEIRARLAFIEETERNVQKNFDRLGYEHSSEDDGPSDVLGNADLLADI